MEARVYAEDAYNGFLPQAGTATFVHWSPLARNDEALASGQAVGTSYDPMLGKVIVHGPTREAARKKLVAALDDTAVIGLTTNTGFLRELAASDEFRDADIDTGWLDRNPDGVHLPDDDVAAVFAAWVVAAGRPPRPQPVRRRRRLALGRTRRSGDGGAGRPLAGLGERGLRTDRHPRRRPGRPARAGHPARGRRARRRGRCGGRGARRRGGAPRPHPSVHPSGRVRPRRRRGYDGRHPARADAGHRAGRRRV